MVVVPERLVAIAAVLASIAQFWSLKTGVFAYFGVVTLYLLARGSNLVFVSLFNGGERID